MYQWQLSSLALLASIAASPLSAQQVASPVDQAKALFVRFVQLEQAYDLRVADVYADDAVITNKRTYPNGQVRELTFPAQKYKQLIRQALPVARARGDRSTYTQCVYEPQGPRVRITCARYSELKKYSSPYVLVVGPGGSGRWQILEELSESQP
jgi:hypothetical protein